MLREKDSLMAAAEALYLTQSTLSYRIKDVEERLGVPLFIRNTHPVRFTDAGLRLLALADSVLPLIEDAKTDLSRIAGGDTGRLLMAIECHSCFDWVIPAMESFRSQHSSVTLDLTSGFNFDALPALARGDLDLVITSDPAPIHLLHYQPLFRYESVLVLPQGHALVGKKEVKPQDIAEETLIAYPIEHTRMDLFNLFLRDTGIQPAEIRQVELTPVIMQLVASGRGIACLPFWVASSYADKGMVSLCRLGAKGCWNTLFAALRKDQLKISFMQDFLDILHQACTDRLPSIKPAKAPARD